MAKPELEAMSDPQETDLLCCRIVKVNRSSFVRLRWISRDDSFMSGVSLGWQEGHLWYRQWWIYLCI